jgi:hypothetical protein
MGGPGGRNGTFGRRARIFSIKVIAVFVGAF